MNVIGLLAYAFKGIGKFAVVMLPWRFTGASSGVFSDENVYAMILMGLTAIYAIKGGMVSVVITEVMQFTILTLTALCIGVVALMKVSPEMIAHNIPAGWMNPFFGWKLHMDWDGILKTANAAMSEDHNDFFSIIFGLMFFGEVLASLAWPRAELRHATHPRERATPSEAEPHERDGRRFGLVFPDALIAE